MPNIPQQQTIVQYVTNSAQTAYTFAFYAPLNSDIQVYYQSSTATPVPATDILTLNVDYTVTFNVDPITGGTINLLFTPVTGYYLTINRQVAASLNTAFSNAQNFNGANLDAALDRLLLLCQQNQNYNLERNLSYIINTYLPNATPYTQLPPLAQNFVWIGSGSGIVAAEIATSPSASVLQSLLANSSPGTDGARLVGYYDAFLTMPTTVQAKLASLSENTALGTNGAALIGYYDTSSSTAMTVFQKLRQFEVNSSSAIDGASYIGYYDTKQSAATTVDNKLDSLTNFFGVKLGQNNGTFAADSTPHLASFPTSVFDTNSISNVAHTRFTPIISGGAYVQITASLFSPAIANNARFELQLYKNGSPLEVLDSQIITANGSIVLRGTTTDHCNGTTDYYEIYGANFGANPITMADGTFQLALLGQ